MVIKEQLQLILSKHKDWLAGKPEGERANLQCTDLQNANLLDADLLGANLLGANLRGANLQYTDLEGANLRGADLQNADLQNADLQGADLRGANLRGANLQGANLKNCSLANNRNPFLVGNFSIGKHLAVATQEYLAIGCEQRDWEYWLENFESLGEQNEYSTEEIRKYGELIRMYNSFRRGDDLERSNE